MSDTQTLKIALVGCGGIAQRHWHGIQEHAKQLLVSAVVDTDPDRAQAMAKQTGGQPFTSLAAALAEGDFAAVDIMLPHNQHEAAAVTAFAAGKHVVLEKPMSTTVASCNRILAAAKQAGTVFMVAEQAHYWPDVVQVRQLIQEGRLARSSRRVAALPVQRQRRYPSSPGAMNWPWLAAASRSMAARIGCVPCASGWAKSMR